MQPEEATEVVSNINGSGRSEISIGTMPFIIIKNADGVLYAKKGARGAAFMMSKSCLIAAEHNNGAEGAASTGKCIMSVGMCADYLRENGS